MKILTTVLLALACAAGFGASAGAADTEWTPYTSKEFGFAALFPGTPGVETKDEKVQLNGKPYAVTMHTISAKGANASICLVVHSVYTWPIAIEPELTADRDNFTKGISGTVTTSSRTTALRGAKVLPAILFDATGINYNWRSLVVIDGQAVYEVAGGVPSAGGDAADLDRCVKGFVLPDTN